MAAAAGGALLSAPYWVPRAWVRDLLAVELSELFGRPTRLASVEFGWREGVRVTGIEVPGLTMPLLRLKEARCAFQPWQWFQGRGVDRLEFVGPVLNLVIDRDGRLNLGGLRLRGGPPPTRAIVIRQAELTLTDERVASSAAVELGDVELTFDDRSGLTNVLVDGKLIRRIGPIGSDSAGEFTTSAKLVIPAVRRPAADAATLAAGAAFGGEGSLAWRDVDLSSLPLKWFRGAAELGLAGRCSGEIRARVDEALEQEWSVAVGCADLEITRSPSASPWVAEKVALAARGRWLPVADVLEVDEYSLSAPGVELDGAAREEAGGVTPDGGAAVRLTLDRSSHVRVAGRLHRVGDWLDKLPKAWQDVLGDIAGARSGELRFAAAWRRDGELWRSRVSMTSGTSPSAEAASLGLTMAVNEAGRRVDVEAMSMRLGAAGVTMEASLPLPPIGGRDPAAEAAWLQAVWREGRLRLSVDVADLDETRRRLVGADALQSGWQMAGPARFEAQLHPGDPAEPVTVLDVRTELGASASCRLGEFLVKPAGDPLTFSVSTRYPAEPDGLFDDIRLEWRCGDAKIATTPSPGNPNQARLACTRVPASPNRPAAEAEYYLDVSSDLALAVESVERIMALSPRAAALLGFGAEAGVATPAARGDATLVVRANVRHSTAGPVMQPDLWRVFARLDATSLAIRRAGAFEKPAGAPATADFNYWFDRHAARGIHRLGADVTLPGMRLAAGGGIGGGPPSGDLHITVDDVLTLAPLLPSMREAVDRHELSGGAVVSVRNEPSADGAVISASVDLTGLGFRITPAADRPADWRKPAGTRCSARMELRTSTPSGLAAGNLHPFIGRETFSGRFDLERLECRLGDGTFSGESGFLALAAADAAARAEPAGSPDALLGRVLEARLVGRFESGPIEHFESLGQAVTQFLRDYGISGACRGELTLSADSRAARLSGGIDLGGLALRIGEHWSKHAGWPAAARLSVEMPLSLPGEVTLGEALVSVGQSRAELRGPIRLTGLGGPATATNHENGVATGQRGDRLEIDFQLANLAEPAWASGIVLDGQRLVGRAGSVAGSADVEFRDGLPALVEARVRARKSQWAWQPGDGGPEIPLAMDGEAILDRGRLSSPGMDTAIGGLRFTVAGDVSGLPQSPKGTVALFTPSLDGDELSRIARRVAMGGDDGGRALWERTARLEAPDFSCVAHVHHARFAGVDGGAPWVVDELRVSPRLAEGRVEVPFSCAVEGGVVSGSLRIPLVGPEPFFDLEYEARGLAPSEATRPIVEDFFPGMEVSGSLSLTDRSHQRLWASPGVPSHPTGDGEMVIGGGVIVGRAAPLWVTSVFPGLNVARFEFTRMVNRFEKLADGTHNNVMTFYGPTYHMYVDGYSKADGAARYEVGVDLLAKISPDLARLGQGRIALFIKTGVIRNGVMENEQVNYLSPVAVTQKILTNNLLTMAYHAVKKEVAGGS